MTFVTAELSPTRRRRIRLLAALAVAAVTLFIAWKLLAVLLPFFASGGLAYLLVPLVNLAERRTPLGRRRPKATRMAMAGLILLVLALLVLALMGLGLLRIVNQSTALVESAPDLVADAQHIYETTVAEYEGRVPPNIREVIDPRLMELRQSLVSGLNEAMWRLFRILQTGVGVVVSLATMPIILFYLLYQPDTVGRGVKRLLPRSVRDDLTEIGRLTGQSVGMYLRAQLLLGAMMGLAIGIGLWVMEVPQALVFAILAAFLELILIVGPVIWFVVAAVVMLVTDVTKAPFVLALYLILQALQNMFIAPRVQGQALGLHPLAIVLALAVFGLLLGFWGVLLAAPFTAAGYRVISYAVREWDEASPEELVSNEAGGEQVTSHQVV